MTLIEVMAALAILGSLLVGILLAKNRLSQQSALASRRLDAVAAADGLLTSWRHSEEGIPREASGEVPGYNGFAWETKMREDRTAEFASVRFKVLDPNAMPQVLVVTPVKSGEPIKVSWIGSPGNRRDWIGLYNAGVTNTRTYIKWLYTEGAIDGAVSFTDSLPPGEYVARLLIDNGYEEFACSTPFTVTAP